MIKNKLTQLKQTIVHHRSHIAVGALSALAAAAVVRCVIQDDDLSKTMLVLGADDENLDYIKDNHGAVIAWETEDRGVICITKNPIIEL